MSKTPKLRFKEFSGDWESNKLSNYTEKITRKNKDFLVTNVISNSARNGLVSQRDFFDKDIANQNNIDGYYIIENGDFVYNPRKSLESPYGPINRYNIEDAGVVSPLYLCFKINEKVNGKFLEYYFKSSKWYRFIYQNSDQGARHDRVSIKDSEFFKLNTKFPSLEEQEKIASFFSLIDEKISLQGEKVEALKDYKRGIMQKIFSRELRFKDDEGKYYPEWKEKKLGDICELFAGGTPSTNVKEYWDGDINWITSGIVQNCTIYEKDVKTKITELGLAKSSARLINPDSVLIAMTGATCGKIGYLTFESTANQSVMAIEPYTDISKFVYYLLIHNNRYILKFQAGGAQAGINKSSCSNLTFKFPSIPEQEKIADFLSIIDSKIELEEQKLEQLKEMKKGLLQQMFV